MECIYITQIEQKHIGKTLFQQLSVIFCNYKIMGLPAIRCSTGGDAGDLGFSPCFFRSIGVNAPYVEFGGSFIVAD